MSTPTGKNPAMPNGGKIFVDADAFVSLANPDDGNHHDAVAISQYIKSHNLELMTSNFALGEAITVISQKTTLKKAMEFGKDVFSGSEVLVIDVDRSHQLSALEQMSQAKSKNVRFTDFVNMVLMNEWGIATIFSFDRHYKLAGFTLLTPQTVL